MIRRVLLIGLSVFLFVLSLELIQRGALDFVGVLNDFVARSPIACLGLGWLLAAVVLSGSPVAATSLVFLATGTLNVHESYAMIIGSRLGASFVVLLVGFIYDWRSRQSAGGVYVGVLAFLVTATVYLPALGLGYLAIDSDVFGVFQFNAPLHFITVVETIFTPIVGLLIATCKAVSLPLGALAVVGIGVMVLAFKIFDTTLPTVDPLGGRLGQMATTIFRPSIAFLLGMIITCITLSVSVSLTLLVPLTVRGIIRRENLIPFILGANITTFVDTLVASVLIDHPSAFALVLCSVLMVTMISLPIVFMFYRPYERLIDDVATFIVGRRWRLTLFVGLLFLLPTLLLLIQV